MPTPNEGESKNDYIGRCVEYCMKEEGMEQRAALGKCYGMWRQAQKNEDIEDKIMAYIHNCDRFDIDMPPADYTQRCMELINIEEGEYDRKSPFKKPKGKKFLAKCPQCGENQRFKTSTDVFKCPSCKAALSWKHGDLTSVSEEGNTIDKVGGLKADDLAADGKKKKKSKLFRRLQNESSELKSDYGRLLKSKGFSRRPPGGHKSEYNAWDKNGETISFNLNKEFKITNWHHETVDPKTGERLKIVNGEGFESLKKHLGGLE